MWERGPHSRVQSVFQELALPEWTLLKSSPTVAAALFQAMWSSYDFGVLRGPPRGVNLASKSRSGAPLGSLSDLLKGLAPGSRNANQPTGPNLTSAIPPNPRQGTLKIGDYAGGSSRSSSSLAIYNPLAFWGEPDTSRHSEVLSTRPVASASGAPPRWAAPARTPKGVSSPGSRGAARSPLRN